MRDLEKARAASTTFLDRRLAANEIPGLQYLVLGPDAVIFGYSGGWADISARKPMRDATTQMIYSMTKTFTAAAVLQLVEQGRVELEGPLRDHIDGAPYGGEVTIRQLLSQTSGMPNPIPLRWVHLAEEHGSFDETAALGAVLARYPRLRFKPGLKYGYSNVSYWLLGRVIAKASGSTYENYVRDNVFARLGMPKNEIDFVIPSPSDHAKGYLRKMSLLNLFKSLVIDSRFTGAYEDGWLRIKDHYLSGPAFGGIVATARAVGLFLQDQLRDGSKLFSPRTKELFFKQQRNNAGEPIPMTLGWHTGMRGGRRCFFKEGGGGGFHSEMRIYPGQKIGSVTIANSTSFRAGKLLDHLDEAFFS